MTRGDQPAFPNVSVTGPQGITIREFYAAMAMQSLLNQDVAVDELAWRAFKTADAMVQAGPGPQKMEGLTR